MTYECSCADINIKQWNELMKGAKPINGRWLRHKIQKHLPELARELCLEFYNPYEDESCATKTHYIYVHSCIEFFIRKD